MKDSATGHGADGKKWRAKYDPKFERQRRGLGKELAERVDRTIEDLLVSENVRDARDGKGRIFVGGMRVQTFACRVGRSYRILYCVEGDCMHFLRVGDHKAVYGKD